MRELAFHSFATTEVPWSHLGSSVANPIAIRSLDNSSRTRLELPLGRLPVTLDTIFSTQAKLMASQFSRPAAT